MKKIFLTAALTATLFTGAFAADAIKVTKASYQLQAELYNQFAGAENIIWIPTSTGQKASFDIDGVKMSAYFNNQGQFLGHTEAVTFRQLPSAAKKQLAETYKGYMVNEVLRFQPSRVISTYERVVGDGQDGAYYVDLKGDAQEVLVKVTPEADVTIEKTIK
ncbi:hypothetical protein [Mucilaginibacter ginkgonis]|uniref:Uncharacterized protein n=1 Tax=Mucilaginibacter ginkgonis TaxID=2682091 RepID=A0A6I4IMF8_9SPHI|nr:hypothetical protein [Mucilaginibacter ginkgonis]QQL50420.1 hypothetical protein GO620_002880 [Mucilaginibacter ginkgonis]